MKYNIEEIKDILKYMIKNNQELQEQGKKPNAISLRGDGGTGKTSAIMQIAKELDMPFTMLRLSQLEEVGDILGMPIKEYEVCINNHCHWIAKDILPEYIKAGAEVTGNHRMGYSVPAWVPQTEEPVILLMDDYSRCSPMMMQAVMEIINMQEFTSWKLPKGSTIILSENPDNEDYTLGVSLDSAMRSRFITFDVDFDVKVWARWAEEYGLRTEAVNFMLWAPELITKKQNLTINARSMTSFFNAISGLKDWSTTENLAMIMNIASGCFEDEANAVGNMFTTFINNKLHLLVTPEEMLNDDWDKAKRKIKKCVYDGEIYRADIASILSIRFINYVDVIFSTRRADTMPVVDRVIELVTDADTLLTEDLIFNMVKTLTVKYKTHKSVTKLITNRDILKKILN